MQVLCIGGACVDRTFNAASPLEFGSSNPVERARSCFGGVARNVAENLARLGIDVALAAAVGNDAPGAALREELRAAGVGIDLLKTLDGATDEYVAVLQRGELVVGLADMRAAESLSPADLDRIWERVAQTAWLFAECNLTAELLRACFDRKAIARYRLAVDAVSAPKARRLPARLNAVDVLFINEGEARAYLGESAADAGSVAEALLARGAQAVVLTQGERGAICAVASGVTTIPAVPAQRVSATGAGDALIAGTLARLIAGNTLREAVSAATQLAARTLESERTVVPEPAR